MGPSQGFSYDCHQVQPGHQVTLRHRQTRDLLSFGSEIQEYCDQS